MTRSRSEKDYRIEFGARRRAKRFWERKHMPADAADVKSDKDRVAPANEIGAEPKGIGGILHDQFTRFPFASSASALGVVGVVVAVAYAIKVAGV